MYHPRTRWDLAEADEQRVTELAQKMNLHPKIARLLILRGLKSEEEVIRFLRISKDSLYDPFLLRGMHEAVMRIRRALDDGERIWIYGDYDADGVTSTSLLIETFRLLGREVDYYIPNRFTEGYGLHAKALEAAAAQGVTLVITVDTGISAITEARTAQTLGIDLIITDHHEPPDVLPEPCVAIINPKQPGCDYPAPDLAGVGIAFKLAHALLGHIPESLVSLAALGTIADLVPLVDENRVIAALGLRKINERQHVGINALLDVTGLSGREVTAGHVSYVLGPRLNASGRLETAQPAVELLTSRDPAQALLYAQQLDDMNKERQKLVDELTEEAIAEVTARVDAHRYAIVLARPGWNIGVLGIVASRLVERFYRPTVVLSIDEATGQAQGSARSITGFDLYEALSTLKDLLTRFGGHKMAAGMTLGARDIDLFRERLSEVASDWLTEEDYKPKTDVDITCTLHEIEMNWVEQLSLLEPFGVGNRTPRFQVTGGQLAEIRRIGHKKNHLRLSLKTEEAKLQAVGFEMGDIAEDITTGAYLDAVGELQINEWNGNRSVQLLVKDVAVPHVQVFDWRGRMIHEDIWHRLATQGALFVCFKKTNMRRVYEAVPGEKLYVYCANGTGPIPAYVKEARRMVFVDYPTDVTRYQALLRAIGELEYVYYFGETDEHLYIVPHRRDFKQVFAFLHRHRIVDHRMAIAHKTRLPSPVVMFILDVFAELGFIEQAEHKVRLKTNLTKRSLEESFNLRKRKQHWKTYQAFYYASSRELTKDIMEVREGQPSRFAGGDNHGFQRENSHRPGFSSAGSTV